MPDAELTRDSVLVQSALAVTAAALAALLVLAFLSQRFGAEFVLAIDAANAAARADRLERTGQYKSALSEYYRLLEIRPHDSTLRAHLVALQLRRGESDEALVHAELLLGEPPSTDRPRDLVLYGDALEANSRHDAAATAYHEALKLQPEFPDALHGLAVQALLDGNVEEARSWMDRLRNADPATASRVYNGPVRDGALLQQRAQERDGAWPLNRRDTNTLIAWHLKHGRLDDAVDVYRQTPRWEPWPRERAMRAVARALEVAP